MIFFNTDRRMDGESHKLTHHPKQVQAEILYTPIFLPLTKRSELVKQAHSVLFGWIVKQYILYMLVNYLA